MGLSAIEQKNVNLIKLAMQRKAGTVNVPKKPEYLQLTGSIFNASQNNKVNPTTNNLFALNTQRSIEEIGKPKNKDESIFGDIGNASQGKAAIAEGRSMQKQTESYTQEAEAAGKRANTLSAEGKKLSASILDEDKQFSAKLTADQNAIKRDNEKIERLVRENEEKQKEVEDAQRELESLQSNSFTVDYGNSTPKNSARINELRAFIGARVSSMQNNGKTIYSLQRSSSRSLARMNRTNRQYVNAQKTHQSNIKNNQNETSGVIKVANKIEEYSALAQTAGQTLNIAGQALVALGYSTSFLSFGGTSVLVAIGTVMQKVGTVLNLAGQYGQAAANITKTAAYAAEGNLIGAMQSAAAAIQTGAAATKSTMTLKSDFGKINQKATEAGQKIAANAEAKEQVKNMQNEAVQKAQDKAKAEGRELTKKEIKEVKNSAFGTDANGKNISAGDARRIVSEELQEKMKNDKTTFGQRTNKAFEIRDNKTKLGKYGDTAKNTDFSKKLAQMKKGNSKTFDELATKVQSFGQGIQMASSSFGQNGQGTGIQSQPHTGKKDKRYNYSFYHNKIMSRIKSRRTA